MPVAMGLYLAARAAARLPYVDLTLLCGFSFPISEFGSYLSFLSPFFYRSISISLSTGSGRQEHPLLLISLSSRFGCFSFSFLSLLSIFFLGISRTIYDDMCLWISLLFIFSFFTACVPIQIFGTHSIYREVLPCVAVVLSYIRFFSHHVSTPALNLFLVIFPFYLVLLRLSFSFFILPPQRRLIERWLVLGPAYTHVTSTAVRAYNNYIAPSSPRLPRTGQHHIFCMTQPVIYHSYLQDLIISSRMFHYIRHRRLYPEFPLTPRRHRLRHVQRGQ
jgi:hypothetical protein